MNAKGNLDRGTGVVVTTSNADALLKPGTRIYQSWDVPSVVIYTSNNIASNEAITITEPGRFLGKVKSHRFQVPYPGQWIELDYPGYTRIVFSGGVETEDPALVALAISQIQADNYNNLQALQTALALASSRDIPVGAEVGKFQALKTQYDEVEAIMAQTVVAKDESWGQRVSGVWSDFLDVVGIGFVPVFLALPIAVKVGAGLLAAFSVGALAVYFWPETEVKAAGINVESAKTLAEVCQKLRDAGHANLCDKLYGAVEQVSIINQEAGVQQNKAAQSGSFASTLGNLGSLVAILAGGYFAFQFLGRGKNK
jgi:hypothetical protein